MLNDICILYVEDDKSSAEILTLYLQKQGYKVTYCDNAIDANRALDNLSFHLAIFDIMLPGGDGRTLLEKAVEKSLPSMMVTAKVAENDRINGFDLGADDYVCKPYSPREVVSRVQALLKRTYRETVQTKNLRFQGLQIDLQTKLVEVNEQAIKLTAVEFSMLTYLANKAQHIISRDQLISQVWGDTAEITDRAVDTHLANLRKKLGDSKKAPKFIATHYGQGYQFIAGKVS
ncbi:response regulator transcription factor [Thalassotalea marina]|uniref:DNA-binding response regulator n=1 Tax=Thalassotalea marina TaxID=1673741 RepID=A0A919BLT0_9GAMM|nr:response regulator transcription factor [Thalassotalea marina]GHF97884.1 DNA-binding response regulator [Thalassotalea marina]